jgi:hypothetical protein
VLLVLVLLVLEVLEVMLLVVLLAAPSPVLLLLHWSIWQAVLLRVQQGRVASGVWSRVGVGAWMAACLVGPHRLGPAVSPQAWSESS